MHVWFQCPRMCRCILSSTYKWSKYLSVDMIFRSLWFLFTPFVTCEYMLYMSNTSGVGTAILLEVSEFPPLFNEIYVAQYLICCVVFLSNCLFFIIFFLFKNIVRPIYCFVKRLVKLFFQAINRDGAMWKTICRLTQ